MDHRISKDMISSGMTPSGEKAQEDLGRTQYGSNPTPNAFADAYKSMYEKKEEVINEHHKKDADGNTIPHEGEEINEALPLLAAPLIAKGLMAAKAGAAIAAKSKLGAAAIKGGLAFKKGLTTAKAVGAAGKITTSGGKLAAGATKVGKAQQAGQLARAGLASMKNNPLMTTVAGTQAYQMTPFGAPKMPKAPMNPRAKMTGARTAGVYASADLFDIVKGKLLDEGIDEKDIKDIMVNLKPDEILNEVSAKLLMKASRAADMKRAQLARAGNKAGAAAKATQATNLYQGAAKRNIAKQDLSKPLNPQRKDYPMGKGANYQQKPGM